MHEITDADIAYAEALTGLRFQDPERRDVLKRMDSVDVWACPGSGKTSLLVSKLAVLGRHWRTRHQGICVLSHTKVARHEIEQKLATSESRALLSAPHFVGTIQSWVDQFLGRHAAWLRFNVRPRVIDSDRFRLQALRRINHNAYRTARAFLKNRANGDDIIGDLHFDGPDLQIKLPVRESTPTGQQLIELKLSLAREGVFCYDDMYALAEWYLREYPQVAGVLARRFPVLFIDEMQDTDEQQWRILGTIFQPPCIVQRFGDNHQSIFRSSRGGAQGGRFPGEVKTTIRTSHRLSCSISKLVGRIAPEGPIPLTGNAGHEDLRHQIILFDRSSVSEVLPFFAGQVSQQVLPLINSPTVKAVGAIARPGEDRNFPHSLCCYWDRFAAHSAPAAPADSMAEYVQDAIASVQQDRRVDHVVDAVATGLVHVLSGERVFRDGDRPYTARTFLRELKDCHHPQYRRFAQVVTSLCVNAVANDRFALESVAAEYASILEPFTGRLSSASRKFLSQPGSPERAAALRSSREAKNIYRYPNGGSNVEIHVSTIHAVKGETHDATLVLETYYHKHDLSTALSYILGDRRKQPGIRLQDYLKRMYVATTRPRYLLCLALFKKNVPDPLQDELSASGWQVHDVAS